MKIRLININNNRKADSAKTFTYYKFLYVNTRTAINNIYSFISVYTYNRKDSYKKGQINPFLMINKGPFRFIGDAQPLKQDSTYHSADLAATIIAHKNACSTVLSMMSSLNYSQLFFGSKKSLALCRIECAALQNQYKISRQKI